MKKNYAMLFDARYKALGYFADELLATNSDYDFFEIIANKIVPLICNGKAYEHFFFRFNRDKVSYVASKDAFVAKAPVEVEEAFKELQKILAGNASPEIQQQLEQIENVFNNKCKYRMPPYLQVAYEKINSLLQLLLDDGEAALVSEYAKIEQQAVNFYNQQGEAEAGQRWVIKEFTYAPSLQGLNELKRVLDWNPIRASWVAWENLYLVLWCWNTPFSFFADKSLDWKNYEASISSAELLMLHEHWAEVNAIKNVKHDDNALPSSLFRRSIFITFIKTVLDDILLQQELEKSTAEEDGLASDVIVPEVLTLRLDDRMSSYKACLQLDVKWAGGESEDILLHNFQDASGPYSFVKALLFEPIGTPVDTRTVGGSSGGTVAKYFEQCGLKDLPIDFFMGRPKRNSTCIAFMKAKSIRYDELSKEQQIKIMAFIKRELLKKKLCLR